MESNNIVKCSQCNIVISEVLSFIQNKIDVMCNDSLIQICKSAFSEEEVKHAKCLLFQAIPHSKRMINRKSKGKVTRDLEDIISLFKQTDPELIPVFVARDLHKLPPITFDHVDVTSLLRNILVLQSEVKYMKENFVTQSQVEEIYSRKISRQHPVLSPIETTHCNINSHRGACMLDESSYIDMCEANCTDQLFQKSETNIMSTDMQTNKKVTVEPTSHRTNLSRTDTSLLQPLALTGNECVSVPLAQVASQAQRVEAPYKTTVVSPDRSQRNAEEANERVQRTITESEQVECRQSQPADMLEKSWANIAQGGEWKQVINKRKIYNRFKGNKGRAVPTLDGKFKAADIKTMFYIYNVDKNATAEDIRDYVLNKTQVEISPELITMKQAKGYIAYKFRIPRHKLPVFLDENLWPEGISFRRFFSFNKMRGQVQQTDNTRNVNERVT